MPYTRVLPRDLFNEAKLLKCLGQIALHLHDYEGRWPVDLQHEDCDHGFRIDQDPDSGDLFCTNLYLYAGKRGEFVTLKTSYNSKSSYPLYFVTPEDESEFVFNDDGSFSTEFLNLLES